MSLRVISGTAKGRRLKSVPGDSTRPVTDRVKEALFNILSVDVKGSTWLDLFAGTGAVGIEALSRGAAYVRFIDIHRPAIETVRWNITQTGFSRQAEIRRSDAFVMLSATVDQIFDYIYIAPPQYKEYWVKSLELLDIHPGWLAEDGWIMIQIHPKEFKKLELNNFSVIDERKYGSTLLIFYEKK